MNGTHSPLPPTPAEQQDQQHRDDSGAAPRRRSRRTTAALVCAFIVLVLLAIFLPPLINLGHYRRNITASISLALGRPVYVGDMQLRLLPLPGIVLSDFTVEEDPAFGSEPVLHANSVVAYLRLSSLWRGRLEVSRISLDEASLNLVKNDAGQWNIGSILLRASQIPNAPTAERHAGPNLRFPYIEATDSRINLKEGVEKKPFSLMNAEFSMWQAADNEWRLRLKAQPVRTDRELHLSDTGTLTLQGSLRRAATLDTMPVDLTAEWSGAQLGQASRLLAGFDSGWRGDLDATATFRGPAANLAVRSRVKIGNLRRLEFQPLDTVDVDAACQAAYHHMQHLFTGVTCFWPVSAGHLLLTAGSLSLVRPDFNLSLEINRIPAQFPLSLLGLMRPRLSALAATGVINGKFDFAASRPPHIAGDAEATGVALTSGDHTLQLPALHFISQSATAVRPRRRQTLPQPIPDAVVLQPVSIPFGAPQPLIAEAHLTRSGFALHFSGQASLERLTAAAAQFGLLGNSLAGVSGRGRAEINATTADSWLSALTNPRPAPSTTGSIRLQNILVQPAFLHAPLQIQSADLFLTPQQISWENVAFRYQNLALRGSLQLPALCPQQPCPVSFALQDPALDAGEMEAALLAHPKASLFGQLLSNALGSSKPASWPPLHGSVQAAALQLGRLPVRNVAATVAVEGTSLTLSSLAGTALGGALHASGSMKLDAGLPAWSLTAQITGAKAAEAGALFHQHWGSGLITGDIRLTASGYHLPELLSSAKGDFRATWQKGGLTPGPGTPLPLSGFDRWSATGLIANRTLTITSGAVVRNAHANPTRGTIGFDRTLDLTMQTPRSTVSIGGSLGQPAASQP